MSAHRVQLHTVRRSILHSRQLLGSTTARHLHLQPTVVRWRSSTDGPTDSDSTVAKAKPLDDGAPVKGYTGGGEPLESSSKNAVPKPKISNLSVPGNDDAAKLTKEQKAEVDRHNEDFEKKHDRGTRAPEDKVDKKFWSGQAHE